ATGGLARVAGVTGYGLGSGLAAHEEEQTKRLAAEDKLSKSLTSSSFKYTVKLFLTKLISLLWFNDLLDGAESKRGPVTMEQKRKSISEDWLSVLIGLLFFSLSLGVLVGADVLGWVVTTSVWNDISKALAPASKAYAGLGGIGALIVTYVVLLGVLTTGA